MIEVKFYGLIRLESGIKSLHVEAASMKELYLLLESKHPILAFDELKKSIVLVNGKRAGMNARLCHGDVVQFLSPSAGG